MELELTSHELRALLGFLVVIRAVVKKWAEESLKNDEENT